MAEFQLGTAGIVLIFVLVIVFLAVYFASRYRKFKTNEYVIHLRNGKVHSAGRGGKIIKLPLIDEIIVIPTTTRKTLLNSSEKILSREYQDVKISAILYWRVSNPQTAFNAVDWNRNSPDYVERILSTATEAIIRTTCAGLEIEKIICDRNEIIKLITDQLLNLTQDWGIVIESLEIIEVQVLDHALKDNMEAIKKIEENRKAKLSQANATEEFRIREIEVKRGTDLATKAAEIQVQRREMERLEIEAEAYRKSQILRAQADAEAIKLKRLAEFEADAEGIRQKMTAEAEGLEKQVAAIAKADPNFITLKLMERLPEIYSHLSPDKMIVVGEGNKGFNSLISSVIPMLELIPEFKQAVKKIEPTTEISDLKKLSTDTESSASAVDTRLKLPKIKSKIKSRV
ncbi:MAG: SPFH domain-containing protein [Promethearchaeota archaeon]